MKIIVKSHLRKGKVVKSHNRSTRSSANLNARHMMDDIGYMGSNGKQMPKRKFKTSKNPLYKKTGTLRNALAWDGTAKYKNKQFK